MRVRVALVAVVAILGVPAGCGDDDSGGGNGSSETLTVFAASSLTSAFEDLGERFESNNDGVEIEFNFGSSSDLVLQLQEGSQADVYASADEANMDKAVDADLTVDPQVFVHNKLEIIVPPNNPGNVTGLEDLENNDLVVSICNEECPAGAYALEIFDKAGVTVEPDSFESEVTAVVTRVSLGEADGGLVYVTDTQAAEGEVEGIDIPDDVNVIATYPITALRDSSGAADRWVDFVLSDGGQSVLQEYGFLPK